MTGVVGASTSGDSYLPEHGNGGYSVHEYHLDLDYKPVPNRLTGKAVLHAEAVGQLTGFTLDFGPFRIGKVLVDGRGARYTHTGGKLRVRAAVAGPFTVEV